MSRHNLERLMEWSGLEGRRTVRGLKSSLGGLAVAAFLLLGALPVSAGINQWTSNGPYGGIIETLAIDPTTPSTIYAGTYRGGLFKSTNGGETWNRLRIDLSYADVS